MSATTGEGDTPLQAALATSQRALEDANQRIENLEVALTTNRRIGMAIGILMTRLGLTQDDAFHCLVQASQQQNRKLIGIAEAVILTGDLPPARRPASRASAAALHRLKPPAERPDCR